MSSIIYNAAMYVRLSKDDGDKAESDSISNQKELIKDFLKSKPEINLCSERVDDGFSGVNFDRPGFQAMMADIRSGIINCVIVKDFSRFGRNYIEVGKHLEHIFPFLGVRFISVNDHYDTANKASDSDELIVPFKNLINDAYSRDISVKIRSQLQVKRKKGDFTGAFAAYGYIKSPDNKNQLIIDEYAAEIVRDIFRMKMEGMSQQGIADLLNAKGELSPMEYKRFHNMNYSTSFKINSKALWTAVAVGRILKNPIYIGVLEQGKVTTPNHKLKKRVTKPVSEWCVVKNAHEPIISKQIFDTALGLLKADTRISPKEEKVFIFSGLLYCADCGNSMARKTVTSKGKKYFYYVCTTKKKSEGCSFHCFKEGELIDLVLFYIKKHIESFSDFEKILSLMKSQPHRERELQKLCKGLCLREQEVEKYRRLKQSLYEDFKEGILEKQDYTDFNAVYSQKLSDAELNVLKIKNDIDNIKNTKTHVWIDEFMKRGNIKELSRELVVSLIQKIVVHENGMIDINFSYQDEYKRLCEYGQKKEEIKFASR